MQAQITREFRHFSIYLGGENLTNYKISDPIKHAHNPWSTAIAMLSLSAFAQTKADTLVVTTTPEMHCEGCENKIKKNIRFVKGTKKTVRYSLMHHCLMIKTN